MYRDYYGFTELPFELTPNPKFLFLAAPYREALSNLRYGVESRKGLTLLLGEAGTGKTTLISTVLAEFEKQDRDVYVCAINNPTLSRAEFIQLLAEGFGLSAEASRSKTTMLGELAVELRSRLAAGRYCALVVDEAQSMPDELLEEIRLLANIETGADKLLPVILAGQPELAERLNQHNLRQLKQRVALRCELRPLTLHETAAYIAARIRTAGGDSARIFTREAVTAIFERSAGIPRLISVLCDNALVTGYALDKRPVTRDVVLGVCRDFDLKAPSDSEVAVDVALDAPPAPAVLSAPAVPRVAPPESPVADEPTGKDVSEPAAAAGSKRVFRFF